MAPAFELKGVSAGYGAAKILFSVDIKLAPGTVTALLGPNGAGKTTTLRVASGLLPLTQGARIMQDTDITRMSTRAIAQKGLCLIPEGRGIFPHLTVLENLLLHTYAGSRPNRADVEATVFEQFPILAERRNQVARTLSGGQQQMLALSRALTTRPSVLLLDEISMGLAPVIVESLFKVIRKLADDGVAVLLVEQLADDALDISELAYVMTRGVIRTSGTPAQVRPTLAGNYLGSAEHDDASGSADPAIETAANAKAL